ncbi:hypothetical protein GALMADRAFT_886499 [Galerina marginata CBS 339.88]|uniref:Uncharacterized protein n=1 Tax=Galerina marginata (strain CBS 339.88) TaxID=685588 RepID=A0A067SKI1_GALM3|nr:hypothetical protein GALMADRAFT_886499 [Galerina marginata CBS 339.88]
MTPGHMYMYSFPAQTRYWSCKSGTTTITPTLAGCTSWYRSRIAVYSNTGQELTASKLFHICMGEYELPKDGCCIIAVHPIEGTEGFSDTTSLGRRPDGARPNLVLEVLVARTLYEVSQSGDAFFGAAPSLFQDLEISRVDINMMGTGFSLHLRPKKLCSWLCLQFWSRWWYSAAAQTPDSLSPGSEDAIYVSSYYPSNIA